MSAPRATVRLTARAEQDFRQILLHTRRTWGEQQRTTYRKAIGQALRRLENHPQLGQERDDLFIGCRSVPVEQHVIYYHQRQPGEIEVLRILHRRQEPTGSIDP